MLRIAKINEYIATRSVAMMSTMACVYLFLVMAMLPLVYPGAETLVQYVSGAVIQLIALPLIMVGQAISNQASEKRAAEDHEMIMQELDMLKQMQKDSSSPCTCSKSVR